MSNTFETKNSGNNQELPGGAKREVKIGKPRYDLIPIPMIKRIAELYARGAEVYGENNWRKGGEEFIEISKAAAFRHFFQFMNGERDEDHMAAVCFNMFAMETLSKKLEEERIF